MTSAGDVASTAAALAGGLAGAGCLYLAVTSLLVMGFRRNGEPGRRKEARAVTLLVPLCGEEPGLAERLCCLRNLEHRAPVQIICGMREAADPAMASVEAASARQGQWPIETVVDGQVHGRNLKISNLINMFGQARHDVVVMIDSDMQVRPDYLRRVTAKLAEPGVGAVTCLYRGTGEGFASRLAAASINLHFLPDAVFGLAVGLARPCFGATIALSRQMLREIGGLRAFADHLWDDYAVGEAVRARGMRVEVCDFAPPHVCAETGFRALIAGQLRAARTVRGIDPAGHAGAVLTHPTALALIAALFDSTWWTWSLVAAAVICRWVLGLSVARRFKAGRPPIHMLVLCDLLAFAIYVMSYAGSTIEWRGRRYRVAADGMLTPATD